MSPLDAPLVSTIQEKCRMCYTCVRECPAKAIRIAEGQASVVQARCIGCGNCLKVCAKKAKRIYSSIPEVQELLNTPIPVIALVAPSFPAEFPELSPDQLAAALKSAGFHSVYGVDFGADLVAKKYKELLAARTQSLISSTCPAVVAFVQKFHPDLVPHLVPIVSPMMAMARVIRSKDKTRDYPIVFIGPCLGKKSEAAHFEDGLLVSSVLTFAELRDLFAQRGVSISPDASVKPGQWEAPLGGLGGLFPLSGGLLQAAALKEDLLAGEIIVAEGKANFKEALREFKKNHGELQLLDILSCNGCVMGAGFSKEETLLERRKRVSRSVRQRLSSMNSHVWELAVAEYSTLDLSCTFTPDYELIQNRVQPSAEEIHATLAKMGKTSLEDELNCGACGYSTCKGHAKAIIRGLAEVEMCLPHTIEQLKHSLHNITEMKEALIQSEKLASMGQLAAGIAHEVNNPLGIIMLYANLLKEKLIQSDAEDLDIVIQNADRCRKIVSGLLNFARQNRVLKQSISIQTLFEDALRAVNTPANIQVGIAISKEFTQIELDRDQMLQVLINIISNAIAAMPNGGRLTLAATKNSTESILEIADTGFGISNENKKKIFEPFFTTKPLGKGTGLGLAVAHGIIKMHQGSIHLNSNDDSSRGPTGTTFTIRLPHESLTLTGVST